ncbi:MAG: hypothetical protein KR126chlam3_01261 [Chlamydiae bacterium]|nr:hypothetical protein [Chlamydiota bacterium]
MKSNMICPSIFSFGWDLFSGLLKSITKPIACALNFFRAKKEEQGIDESRVFNSHTKMIRVIDRICIEDQDLTSDRRAAAKIVDFLQKNQTEIEKDRKSKKEFFKLVGGLSVPGQLQFGEFYYLSSPPRHGKVIVPTRLQACKYFQEYRESERFFDPPETQASGG